MHGLAWLPPGWGVAGEGAGLLPHADFPMYVSVTVCSVCIRTFGCCCLFQYMLPYACRRRLEMHGDFTGELAARLGLSTCRCIYVCMQSCLGFTAIHVAICI